MSTIIKMRVVPNPPETTKGVGYESPALQAKLEKAKRDMGRRHCLHPKTTSTLTRDVLGDWKAQRIVGQGKTKKG